MGSQQPVYFLATFAGFPKVIAFWSSLKIYTSVFAPHISMCFALKQFKHFRPAVVQFKKE